MENSSLPTAEPSAQPPYRILVIDDEPANLDFVRRSLRNHYHVETFSSATAALTRLDQGARFDLALADQKMPGMTGIEFLSQLRQRHPQTMRLVLTAYSETPDLLAAINRGEVYRYVTKPCTADNLLVILRQALDHYQLARDRDRLLEELARATYQLQEKTRKDPLTGLASRHALLERVATNLARSERKSGDVFALLVLDLDRFHVINKALGRQAGDETLAVISQRLEKAVRLADMAARLPADRFAVLLDSIDEPSDSLRVANRILHAISVPIETVSGEVTLTGTAGITTSTADYVTAEAMLGDAEDAVRQAKNAGGSQAFLFDPEERARSNAKLQLEIDLRRAIENEDWLAYYQPIVSVTDGTIVGAEALVRWAHPQRGILLPGAFVPMAEDTRQIPKIDEWILREACSAFSELRRREWNCDPLSVSVNISARCLHQHDVLQCVVEALRASTLEPAALNLELTESALLDDLELSEARLGELKQTGAKLSLDDFGTGYSSLVYLNRFPVDGLKIDRSFISDLGRQPHTQKIVHSIILLALSLGIDVIAEGVETEEQLAILRDLGCSRAQGYFFAKPMPLAEFTAFLQSPHRWQT